VIRGGHSAQRKGKTCESEREQGNKRQGNNKGEKGKKHKERGKKNKPEISSWMRSSKCGKY